MRRTKTIGLPPSSYHFRRVRYFLISFCGRVQKPGLAGRREIRFAPRRSRDGHALDALVRPTLVLAVQRGRRHANVVLLSHVRRVLGASRVRDPCFKAIRDDEEEEDAYGQFLDDYLEDNVGVNSERRSTGRVRRHVLRLYLLVPCGGGCETDVYKRCENLDDFVDTHVCRDHLWIAYFDWAKATVADPLVAAVYDEEEEELPEPSRMLYLQQRVRASKKAATMRKTAQRRSVSCAAGYASSVCILNICM